MKPSGKNKVKELVIDDNAEWLNAVEKQGYKTICTNNITEQEIIEETNNISGIKNIYINLCLLCKNKKKRLDYVGIDLLKTLMLQIRAKHWFLLTFEKEEMVLKSETTQLLKEWKTVSLLDYIVFFKQI